MSFKYSWRDDGETCVEVAVIKVEVRVPRELVDFLRDNLNWTAVRVEAWVRENAPLLLDHAVAVRVTPTPKQTLPYPLLLADPRAISGVADYALYTGPHAERAR